MASDWPPLRFMSRLLIVAVLCRSSSVAAVSKSAFAGSRQWLNVAAGWGMEHLAGLCPALKRQVQDECCYEATTWIAYEDEATRVMTWVIHDLSGWVSHRGRAARKHPLTGGGGRGLSQCWWARMLVYFSRIRSPPLPKARGSAIIVNRVAINSQVRRCGGDSRDRSTPSPASSGRGTFWPGAPRKLPPYPQIRLF